MQDLITIKQKTNTKSELDKILVPVVKKWFYSKFKEYSLPQLFGVMDIHSRKNILVSAPTGATKTLTGFLAIINELTDSAIKGILEDKVYCVYISPLKALNYDIEVNLKNPLKEIEQLYEEETGKKLNIRVAVRTGDTTSSEKTKMLKKPPHILITTPESLAILLSSIKFRDYLKDVDWAIIDEIHALAENKRGVHLNLSIERLSHLSTHLTRIGLSATVSPLEEIAKFLVGTERQCSIVDVQFIKQLDLQVLSPVPSLIDIDYNTLHKKTYELIDKLVTEHKTTLIFTNTRAATERVVHHLKEMFPKNYFENIGAHHGSLSKDHRHSLEQRLREGKIKCVVCSTSLELGIDIGFIDLVICLGSPKSVARTLQRIGRSGHQLHATTKGRIIVMDRDDLIECSVLLKNALEKKIDKIHIPRNSLDVLAQQIYGMSLEQVWEEKELFKLIKQTYCYEHLTKQDFDQILSYLAGEYTSLEDRYIYAKIWRKDGKIGRKGKMGRVIYMTNIGTIPDQTGVQVKLGEQTIGMIDEGFLERLKKRDIFVLGGQTYEFRFARGMTAQVVTSIGKPPTVPHWVSEMLPLSFDLANEIGKFRGLIAEQLKKEKSKKEVITFINEYLSVDKQGAEAIYEYLREQYEYAIIPTEKKIVVEYINDARGKKMVFHTIYGRRVNDVLSRAIALGASKLIGDVELGINDNGFYLGVSRHIPASNILKQLKHDRLRKIMEVAIEQTEVLRRRFRHCAGRAMMILRSYKGRTKHVGRQQMSSQILMSAVKRIDPNFVILKEARREVLEDLMDITNAEKVIAGIEKGTIKIEEITTVIPSPFAFNLIIQGYTDIMKMDDRMEFLKRMHEMVLAKISLDKGRKGQQFELEMPMIDVNPELSEEDQEKHRLKLLVYNIKKVPNFAKEEIVRLIDGEKQLSPRFIAGVHEYRNEIHTRWPQEIADLVFDYVDNLEQKSEKEIIRKEFDLLHKQIQFDPLIYFEMERLLEGNTSGFDKKFKKWLNELLSGKKPKVWPETLWKFLNESVNKIK